LQYSTILFLRDLGLSGSNGTTYGSGVKEVYYRFLLGIGLGFTALFYSLL
jgi:hypothetical protein